MNQWLLGAFDAINAKESAADHNLRAYFSSQPGIGSRDRRLIADRCFDMLRHLRRDQQVIEQAGLEPSNQMLVWLADARASTNLLANENTQRDAFLESVAGFDQATLTPAQRFSLPDWFAESVSRLVGDQTFEALAQKLLQPAALDIRVNTEKTNRNLLREKLQASGVEIATLTPQVEAFFPDTAIRIAGHPALEQTDEFRSGMFEIQDAGSQVLARMAGVRHGQTVVDFCAGGGGKSLAFAALMRNSGNIYCCDVSQRRLGALTPRMNRAGVTCIRPLAIRDEHDPALQRLRQRADVVLVDAPCTGTGTLRRNPALKWQLSAGDVERMAQLQRSILAAASALVRPGGRLIYATCSLLHDENEAVALDFESLNSGFERLNLADRVGFGPDPRPIISSESTGFIRIWPHIEDCDGYFAAGWRAPRS